MQKVKGKAQEAKSISHQDSLFLYVFHSSQFIFVASAVGYTSVSYNGITTPAGGEAYGWILIVTPFIIMVSVAVYQVRKNKGVC